MQLKRAHIFGFGKWIDETFEFNNESFICFYGKNEAGKSTLQQFFLYMLFGLPPRKIARFKPKYSNKIGGTLTIYTSNLGEVTIERVESEFRLFLPDGHIETDERILQEQLHFLQEDSYRAVYGFSSLDLFQLHTLKQQQLSDLLFSVSLTGSTEIYDLERKLNRTLDELFKKAGRRPIINEQITKVNSLAKKMQQAKREVLSYREKVNELEKQQTKLTNVSSELQTATESFTLLEKKLQFLPQLRTFKRVKRELGALAEQSLHFPENGVERYEQLKQQLIPLIAERKNMEKTIHQYEQSIVDQKNKLFASETYDQMTKLLEEQSSIESERAQLKELTKQKIELNTKITEQLSHLHLTEEDVQSFRPAFYAHSTWKQLNEDSKSLQYEAEQLEETADLLNKKRNKLLHEKEEINRQFIGFSKLDQMRAHEKKQTERVEQYTSIHTMLNWEKNRKKQAKQVIYATGALTVLFLLLAFLQQNTSFFIFGGAIGLIVILQIYSLRKSTSHIETLNDQLARLHHVEDGQEHANYSLLEQEQFAQQLNAIHEQLRHMQIEQLQWDEKYNHFTLKEQKWRNAVELEREKHPLLQRIEVNFWVELLRHIETIHELLAKREEIKQEQAMIEANLNKYEERMQKIGQSIPEQIEKITLNHIQSAVQQQDRLIEGIAQDEQFKKETQKQLHTIQEKERVIEQQIKKIFDATEVTEEESFYQKARQVKEKRQLEKTNNELNEQLLAIFPTDYLQHIIDQTIDEFTIERKVDELKETINLLKNKQSDLQRHLGTLQFEIEQLESSDDYSMMTHEYELEREKLTMLAEQWSKIKVAKAILEKAKWTYQQKYITDVMAYTSQYFRILTLEKYTNVYPPTKSNSFQVEANNKMRYTVEELSKGTIDQLYVALRFAISKTMSEKFVVPFMIDDAFVHFDDERATLAVQLLEHIAQEQQVILYTCRNDIVKALKQTNHLLVSLS